MKKTREKTLKGFTHITARIDHDTKEKADEILRKRGMTLSDAIRLLFIRVAVVGEFPLTYTTEDINTLVHIKRKIRLIEREKS